MPQITPSIRRQPFNAIGLARIIPMLGAVIQWIYRHYELGGILPPPKRAILLDMIQLESLDPFPVDCATHIASNGRNVAKGFSPRIGVHHNVSPHHERRVNRHRRPLTISGEAHLDRVQVNVAALKGEEEEEGTRENREQWKSDVHDGYSIRI